MYLNEMPGPSNWQNCHQENYLPYGAQSQKSFQGRYHTGSISLVLLLTPPWTEVRLRPAIVPLPYPVTPELSRPYVTLPPPPQYVEAIPASGSRSPVVDSYRFGSLEHRKLFRKAREGWRSIWNHAEGGSLLQEDVQGRISAGYGSGGPPEGTIKPVLNISFSRKNDQDASFVLFNGLSASIAGYPNWKAVLFEVNKEPQASPPVREAVRI